MVVRTPSFIVPLWKLDDNPDRRLLAGSCLMPRELHFLGGYVSKAEIAASR